MGNVLDVLQERGFIHQTSDADGLRRALDGQVTLYWGYDPTAPSFHIGNLLSIMLLAHMQRHGHRPLALAGGGTGMVGDPSGKTAARPVMAIDEIDDNVNRMTSQLGRYLDFSDGRAATVNNADWLRPVRMVDFLRDVGRHFSINVMLDHEFVRSRLGADGGLSYLEFSYILLQAYDYLHLYRSHGCTLQVGGSDQWANILAGMDLIRRVDGGRAYALVTPLLSTASGRKMGKSEQGSVWLDPTLTRPYEYYQYWVNTEDADAGRFLALYTFLPMEEVRALAALTDADIRHAKEVLAFEATKLTHGEAEAELARATSRALFGHEGAAALEGVPTTTVSLTELSDGIALDDLLVRTGLFKSKREARPRIAGGGVTVNDERITDERFIVRGQHLKDGALLLRTGKRYHRVAPEAESG